MRQPVDHAAKQNPTTHRAMVTPLKTIRGLGASRGGTEHFIRQRLTAIANFVLVLFLVVVAIALSGRSYPDAVELVGAPWVAIPLALAFVSVCLHLKLGLQIIIEDYIHSDGMKMLLLILTVFFCLAVAATGIYSVVRIMFLMTAVPA